ncbi:MAG: DUF1566 domain-containing protein [Flavobacterium sp.]|nr:DUF1566 domain-containing protein [Flavobacterium sp.]
MRKRIMPRLLNLLLLVILLCSVSNIYAQVPQKMSYQAVVRNTDNALISQGAVGVRISILQGSANGVSVYTETHSTTTNTNGLISIVIGDGNVVSGSLSAVNWAAGNFYIKSEIDATGGSNYTIEGSSQLLSVPYALFSANGPPGPAGTFPQGNAVGDMQYWNGTNWAMIPVGSPGQFLQINSSNIPQWSGPRFVSLTTMPITSITQFGVLTGVDVTDDGGYPITKKGICYDTNPNPTIYSQKINTTLITGPQQIGIGYYQIPDQNGLFGVMSAPLLPNTIYYVRAFAENIAGLVYGNELMFTTNADGLPTVTTNAVTNVLAYTATLNGFAFYETPQGPTTKGFCYSVTPNPTTQNTVVNLGSGNGVLETNLTGLVPLTTYYVRAFATNSNGTEYGVEQSFTTCVTPSLTIGQSYAGGTIFHIDCSGEHGLVVVNPSTGLLPWGCPGQNISGTLPEVGTGQSNTNLILNNCADTNNAANFCNSLNFNGYSDWFLPSYKELQKIKQSNISFPGVYYCWSSTQESGEYAYGLNMGPQAVYYYQPKGYSFAVLAVRAF